jgi:Fe-S-cluster-containing dehydrogenase component
MSMKILIDLEKYRSPGEKSCDLSPPEAIYRTGGDRRALKSLREVAVFRYSCRRCNDAPCMTVCPAEALEKDEQGIISRSGNLCVSCKSCVVACPFGTMMTDFFDYHLNKGNYYDLDDRDELDRFIRSSPEGTVTFVEMEEDPERGIYSLDDHILVRERVWTSNNL